MEILHNSMLVMEISLHSMYNDENNAPFYV